MKYHEEVNKELVQKLRERIKTLPSFCMAYFQGIEERTLIRTRLGYATDLAIFFKYLVINQEKIAPKYPDQSILKLGLEDLEEVRAVDIEMFLSDMSLYTITTDDGKTEQFQNGEKGKARKLAAIRSLFKYFYKQELIKADPATLVSTPKIHDKNIIRLDSQEINQFITQVESGEKLTKHEAHYHEQTRLRDVAIVTTLLGTGMRISECVGLDIDDIDFNKNALRIVRKGGNQAIVYFGEEVKQALLDYLSERNNIVAETGHEKALFLSLQKKRMCVRSIEKLVDKYAKEIIPLKHISPHKLRSTYGTALYNQTGDIYLVASVLGHKDVNTTRKHYAALDEDRKREAADVVKLRAEDSEEK